MAIARAFVLVAAWVLLTGSITICKRPLEQQSAATALAGWVCSEWQAGECVTMVRAMRWRTVK